MPEPGWDSHPPAKSVGVQTENVSVAGVGLGLGEDVGGYSLASVWNEEGIQEAYQGPGLACGRCSLLSTGFGPP